MALKNSNPIINVVAAVIVKDDSYLCLQRGDHKYNYLRNKWEFPGGKIEIGESPFEALQREIQEELSLTISLLKPLIINNYSYPDFNIRLHSFLCEIKNLDFELKVHKDSKWLTINDLKKLNWAAADIEIVNHLLENSRS